MANYFQLPIVLALVAPTAFASHEVGVSASSSLRRLQDSGNGYYFLPRGTSCPKENTIRDVDECETAALKFGGILRNGFNPVSGLFGSVPGGCSIQGSDSGVRGDNAIHFDTDFDNDGQGGVYVPICVERMPTSSDYEFLPSGINGCGTKSISTVEECKTAAKQLGGKLRDGKNPVTGTWDYVPCGCSIQQGTGDIHFDTNLSDSCAQDGSYYPVCKKAEATRYAFLPTGVPGCPNDLTITTPKECREAGMHFGGSLRDTANPVTGSWSHVPCGCSISYGDGAIHFDTDLGNCEQRGDWIPVCKRPALPETATFFFEYRILNMEFGEFDEITTKIHSSRDGGLVKNCATDAVTTSTVELELSVANSQSLTVSKSFTSSTATSVTAGVSVTATVEANAIFASASVSATASFEYSKEFGSEATTEDSKTLETSSEITYKRTNSVTVNENSCVQYALSAELSDEPAQVPYTADVHLTVFERTADDFKGEQIRDASTLTEILDLFPGYGAIVDESTGVIAYEIDGVYTGSYASQSDISTTNCDACDTSVPRTSSPVASPPAMVLSMKPVPSPTGDTSTSSVQSTNTPSSVWGKSLHCVALIGIVAIMFS